MQGFYRNINVGSTGVVARSSQSFLSGWTMTNLAAAARHVKLYDTNVAPTENDTPVATISLPANSHGVAYANYGPGVSGITFQRGIGIRATTGVADNDVGAPTANDVVVNLMIES